uniref:C2H2-type domain-containing protein n=1 Tax=Oreochromis aureus TaxID=47969 RepID=A0AAZ1XT22_OREAU
MCLDKHMDELHDAEKDNEAIHFCSLCSTSFIDLSEYHLHMEKNHDQISQKETGIRINAGLAKQHTYECQDCGKSYGMCSSLPQDQMAESGRAEIDLETSTEGKVQLDSLPPTNMTEELYVVEIDEDMESYEPGDFNVQVISASESEDEPPQDLNPDLELVCESDQEGRDDGDIVSKPEMDLKIVQIDFEQADEPIALIAREAENKSAEDRFDCPECYRWFSSSSSHDAFQEEEGFEKNNLTCSECGKVFSRLSALVSHQLHHPKRKQFQCPDCTMSYLHAASLFNHMKTCSAQKKENISPWAPTNDGTKKRNLRGPC